MNRTSYDRAYSYIMYDANYESLDMLQATIKTRLVERDRQNKVKELLYELTQAAHAPTSKIKIQLIQAYRHATASDLGEAKHAVEDFFQI